MAKTKQPLDMYDELPQGMTNYLRHYGRHINKKMYDFAVSQMYKINKSTNKKEVITPISNDDFAAMMKKHNVTLENNTLYDGAYVYSMATADFLGSSIPDEQHLAMFVKDYIDDPDQTDGFVFNRFYADMVLKGEPIDWDEML